MSHKETIDRAYGNIPREVGLDQTLFDWTPQLRGIKYYWYKMLRMVTR